MNQELEHCNKPLNYRSCNLRISPVRFADAFKIAKLKPLLKKGSKMDPKNYRLIFLLPFMSNVLERITNEQTMEILDKRNTTFYTNFNHDFEKIILTIFASMI